jgi:hypothetical protein
VQSDDPNLPYLRSIATALGDLRKRVVFVGGSTAGLLITDAAAEGVRPTRDVDAIVEARDLPQFYGIEAEVAARGFVRDTQSGVICRWIHAETGVLFDLMPVDPHVLGFSNRWYSEAVRTAQTVTIGNGITIRRVSGPAFVATKLEAFADPKRGANDFLASHDLEDVLNVVDGRPELIEELAAAPQPLRDAVRESISALLLQPDFANALPGLIADSGRSAVVMARLRSMVG